LLVPGGAGWRAVVEQPSLVARCATPRQEAGASPRSAPSAFVLGAIGLLDGRSATTHWEVLGIAIRDAVGSSLGTTFLVAGFVGLPGSVVVFLLMREPAAVMDLETSGRV
jgi:putative intracellular protease/amidase